MWEPSPTGDASAPEAVSIRRLRGEEDLRQIVTFLPDLYETNFPGFQADSQFLAASRDRLRVAAVDPRQSVLVAEDRAGLCGFIWVAAEVDYRGLWRGEVRAIYVHPRMRRRGVGRSLMDHGEAYLAACGCHAVTLMVTASNGPACGLYDSLGYRVTRLQMEKPLNARPEQQGDNAPAPRQDSGRPSRRPGAARRNM